MECPKCHKNIADNLTVCPECHKVIALKCPNCGSISESPTCQKCGYTILVKCSKCSKITPYEKGHCSKCGFSLATSLGYQECETDDFASIIVKFGSLGKMRKLLKSQEMYSKFLFKLKNLLAAQLKNVDCNLITYGNEYAINFNKELSLATSSNKAVRLAIKIINAFVELNSNITKNMDTPLDLSLTLVKKSADELQERIKFDNSVKILNTKKNVKGYLKGLQIILDQYIWDEIRKEYNTDSLYTQEVAGQQIMFYEILLDSYVLPPEEKTEDESMAVTPLEIKRDVAPEEKDLYSFKVFDINAKCKFERLNAVDIFEKLNVIDFEKGGKLVSIKSLKDLGVPATTLINYFENRDLKVLRVNCSKTLNYKPWGFFIELFKEYFSLAFHNNFNDLATINPAELRQFKTLFDLIYEKPTKSLTPEDARFAYMEYWSKFLTYLQGHIIIIDGFEFIDDTSLQTLSLYFDKFKNIKPNFIFINEDSVAVHTKIKGLLRTDCYTEITMIKTPLDTCLTSLKLDATDFIQSFYFEKIKSSFRGSYLYFINAIEHLKESGVLIEFENRLILKDKKSVVVPSDLTGLIKARIKNISKNVDASLILGYTGFLGGRLDIKTLQALNINEVETNATKLKDSGLIEFKNGIVSINNYSILSPIFVSLLKKEAEEYLAKNVLATLSKGLDDSTSANMMDKLSAYKEEYLTLWKNAQFSINTGDYDAYLKNCLSFLSLVENIGSEISTEDIEENKKEVYNNILMFLYAYSPEKIYFIENILLMDALSINDTEKIVKLSNLMLQGALISSNYTDALGLLHNILSRIKNPTLITDGVLNTKFLLLSLVNVEILYNIGDYKQCVEVTQEILSVLHPDVIEKVKPASFSLNSFITHLADICRLAAFAKLYLLDDDLDVFFDTVKKSLNIEMPEKDCIMAIKDFLAGKVYTMGNIEDYSAFSKVVFLILQEFSNLENDYKQFAQNIYQAKLLALELHQKELELFCDLLIGYAYSKVEVFEKAEIIYNDVLKISDKSAMFNIVVIAKSLIAQLLIAKSKKEDALVYINDSLAMIRKNNNQAKILFALLEQLYIDTVKDGNLVPCDIEAETMKLQPLIEPLKRILVQEN